MILKRIADPTLIPTDLVEQIDDQKGHANRFYNIMGLMIQSPTHFLYVFLDDKHVIRGYLWYEVNALDHVIFINTISIDKELWGDKEALKIAEEHIIKQMEELDIKKCYLMTDRPAYFEKIGFVKSQNILLQLEI